ncbi:AEC family transporter [Campylobacter sp. RM16187]|uniref:AEC family transporter n=1 Tax=Campylobacter sp. RM16187 TaxID=1660063 RepID=UPI0021B6E1A9|nr:AEC family transporter [Campylobacter sp. RM16187]QKG30110.1 putative membrane protein, predicted permease [Campylobacter sp. RM16187]
MQVIVSAILSIFCIILLGFVLKRKFYKVPKFWAILDSMTYYIFMPYMLFYKIATAKITGSSDLLGALLLVLICFFIVVFLAIFINFFTKFEPAKFTSFFQGSIRYNTYIFLGIVNAMYGEIGILTAAFLMAFIIPLINIFCVCIFAIYIKKGKFSLQNTFKNIAKNPFILACVLGIFANFLNIRSEILEPLKLIGTSAITTGLLSVGAGLKFEQIKNLKPEFYLSSFLKLIFYPLIVFIGSKMINLSPQTAMVCIFFASMPTATSSYILASQMGGDKNLMSLIITLQTLISMVTIWLIYVLASA